MLRMRVFFGDFEGQINLFITKQQAITYSSVPIQQ